MTDITLSMHQPKIWECQPLNFLPCISNLLLNISYDLYDIFVIFFLFLPKLEAVPFFGFFCPMYKCEFPMYKLVLVFTIQILTYIFIFYKKFICLNVLFLQLKNVIGIGYLNDIPSYTHLTSL